MPRDRLFAEAVKDIILAALLGAAGLMINIARDIAHDVTQIKILVAGDHADTASTMRRVDRLEAKVFP